MKDKTGRQGGREDFSRARDISVVLNSQRMCVCVGGLSSKERERGIYRRRKCEALITPPPNPSTLSLICLMPFGSSFCPCPKVYPPGAGIRPHRQLLSHSLSIELKSLQFPE